MKRKFKWFRECDSGIYRLKPIAPSDKAAPFQSDDDFIMTSMQYFTMRQEISFEASRIDEYLDNAINNADISKELNKLFKYWHHRISLSSPKLKLIHTIKKHKLNRLEAECLVLLLLSELGLLSFRSIESISEIKDALKVSDKQTIRLLRTLSPQSRLLREGLLLPKDFEEQANKIDLQIAPDLVNMVICGEGDRASVSLETENDQDPYLDNLIKIMDEKVNFSTRKSYRIMRSSNFHKHIRKIDFLMHRMSEALKKHPNWYLSKALALCGNNREDRLILMAIIGKERTFLELDNDLAEGVNIARLIADRIDLISQGFQRLYSDAPLLKNGVIQPESGHEGMISNNSTSLRDVVFELTDRARELIGLDCTKGKLKTEKSKVLEPRIRLSDLELSQEALKSIYMALNQVQNSDTLMKRWGLEEVFHYGVGATMLFYGTPGTGKTATAEAIASELGRTLMVADYSKIVSCFVGNTEKNITAVFRMAQKNDAVLFWDEADALFTDRDNASKNWEVRDVNVLLQEVEQFRGVCILATNRCTVLDKALERRITAKIEFKRPDRQMRREIWRKLMPKKLPLASDVNFDILAKEDLSGGEIKNVILNAARLALGKTRQKLVTMEDFEIAVAMESKQNWSGRTKIGFST